MSFGIALAGGGTRGAVHVGVLLALEEAELYPTSIAGTSAGSIVAGLYATGTSPQSLKEIVLDMSKRGFYYCDIDIKGILKILPKFLIQHKVGFSGLLKGDRLEQLFCEHTDGKAMKDTNIRTIIPAVDLISGDTIAYTNSLDNVEKIERVQWKTDIPVCQAMRASVAVPAVFQPKCRDGMCLVDGGLTDILPVDLLIAAGEANVLAVDISETYEKPKHNNIIDISTHSLSIMTTRLKESHSRGEKLLLHPNLPEDSGLFSFDEMIDCMQAGYEVTKESIPAIKSIFT
ncbi:MAG TPA: patatin-like phospholipase family protein [Oscillospiraceae bacterium]|nr:patatin-like phospholipase family protein [Oscillospiraceae bacterium]